MGEWINIGRRRWCGKTKNVLKRECLKIAKEEEENGEKGCKYIAILHDKTLNISRGGTTRRNRLLGTKY